ncbi:MAG: hypothetical protein ABRQ39_00480 [Candidatus Eremiobacterota bacterium]
MKKIGRSVLIFSSALLLLVFLSQITLSFKENCFISKAFCAVSETLKVYMDGQETSIVCKGEKDLYMVPVNIPFKEGENKWEVIIRYDKESKKVEVIRKYHPSDEALKTRGEQKPECVWCDGTGECSYCCPVGSGKAGPGSDDRCGSCCGTGKCSSCGGTGRY